MLYTKKCAFSIIPTLTMPQEQSGLLPCQVSYSTRDSATLLIGARFSCKLSKGCCLSQCSLSKPMLALIMCHLHTARQCNCTLLYPSNACLSRVNNLHMQYELLYVRAACTAVRAFASCEEDDMRTLQVGIDVLRPLMFEHLFGVLLACMCQSRLPCQSLPNALA